MSIDIVDAGLNKGNALTDEETALF